MQCHHFHKEHFGRWMGSKPLSTAPWGLGGVGSGGVVLAWPSLSEEGCKGLSGARSSKQPFAGHPAPVMASFPKATQAISSALVHSGRSHQGSGTWPPLAPQRLPLQDPVSALWCHWACREPQANVRSCRSIWFFCSFY